MRKNLPITANEKTFSPNQKLISCRDLSRRNRPQCQINGQVEKISDLDRYVVK